ncbi:ABC transporter permease [Streptomyces sp. ISL-10]|uniref:ABC transporter permease n=1 Tax=Streptomyces sp. ISL-10 TaxID=2819172 RepID=UPI001BE9EC06|nr:ABC transporter permease [Streptomyces sp. ISL-10]MBT2367316.1 ABC transporter permease [Streptomyces sp. ISL-10]
MTTWYHSWRAAIRIARRDAWRSKGRSFLVLAMIALPIVGVSAADLTVRSAELSTEQSLTRRIGGADARLSDPGMGGVPILQSPDGLNHAPVQDFDDQPYPEGRTDIAKALPAGAKTLTDTTGYAKVRTTHGLLQTEIRELKAADPMAQGMMPVVSGRLPQKSDEVAATTHFLESSGLKVGSKLTARGFDREYTIVGSYELPDALDTDQVNALPGALIAPLAKALDAAGLPGPSAGMTLLATIPGGFTWNMVQGVNTKGVVVESRAVALNPPADSEVPLFQKEDWGRYEESTAAKAAALAAIGTVVGLAMLEICLLAGPAFAVGARRSRRQLGLVGANGGDRRHIRAIVLAGGLVIGVAAAVVGTVLGLILTFLLQPVLEDSLGQRFGSFDIRPLELLGIALLAVLTGLLAAIVPAITSSRQSVLASLTGRRGVRRSSRVLPVVGLVAVLLGASIALYGSTMTDQFAVVAGGSAIAELGVVALTPALVGLFGRTGRLLPLSPRLALRDAVRNRGRTAPAVAAVLAAVAGTVAVATYAASNDAQGRAQYEAQLPHGAVSVVIDEAGGRDVPGVRATVQKLLPVDVRADVDRIAVGKGNCSMYETRDGCGRYEVVVPKAHECPLWATDPAKPDEDPAERFSKAERRKLADDWRCKENGGYGAPTDGGVLVGDTKLLKVLGIDDPGAEKALAAGQVVSFDKRNVNAKGAIDIRLITDAEAADRALEQGKEAPGEIKSLTAHQVAGTPDTYGVRLIVPFAAAKAAGIDTAPIGAYYSTDRMPSSEQRQKLDNELDKTGVDINLHIEEGYTSENSIVLLALTVFAGLITIGAAGIATGLAQADAEADLKTLAAVGAPPRVRRTLSGFQCGVVAAMGVVLGSAAGVLPAIGLRLTEKRQQMNWYQEALDNGWGPGGEPFVPIVVPWATLAALLVAVPVGAALLAALVTRSRGALARREAT